MAKKFEDKTTEDMTDEERQLFLEVATSVAYDYLESEMTKEALEVLLMTQMYIPLTKVVEFCQVEDTDERAFRLLEIIGLDGDMH